MIGLFILVFIILGLYVLSQVEGEVTQSWRSWSKLGSFSMGYGYFDFMDEAGNIFDFKTFPKGKHDDQIDALVYTGIDLAKEGADGTVCTIVSIKEGKPSIRVIPAEEIYKDA